MKVNKINGVQFRGTKVDAINMGAEGAPTIRNAVRCV